MKNLMYSVFTTLHSLMKFSFKGEGQWNLAKSCRLPQYIFLFIVSSHLFINTSSASVLAVLNSNSNLTINTNVLYTGGAITGGTVTISAGTTVTFTGALSISGSGSLVIESGAKVIITSGGLDIYNTGQLISDGEFAIRNGGLGLNAFSSATFSGVSKDTIVGDVTMNGLSSIDVGLGVNLFVQGNVQGNLLSNLNVDGVVQIQGNYASNFISSITGTGNVATTGSMTTGNFGSVFGSSPYTCTSNCSGNTPCGGVASITQTALSICSGSSSTFTAIYTGTSTPLYQWQSSTTLNGTYTNISGATSSTYIASPTVTTYYKVRITVGACVTFSNATSLTLTASPTITAVVAGSRCGAGTVNLSATASSGTIDWFATSTGGTSLSTGPSFITPTISSTTTYYVSASNGTCTSVARTPVVATINTVPTITSTSPGTRCGAGAGRVTLAASASAGTIRWFASSTGGAALASGPSYLTPNISTTTTYYVETNNGTCISSPRTAIVATVTPIPTVVSTIPGSRCGAGSVVLSATPSAGTINWYATVTGGTILFTGSSFTTPSIATTTTYYAEAVNGVCISISRTSVVATVNVTPTITATTNASRCGGGTLTIGATPSAGVVNWFTASTGGVSIFTGTSFTTPSITSTTTYYAEATNGTCVSTPRTAVVATVVPIPTIVSTTPGSRCATGTVVLSATPSAGIVNWYSASTGGASIGSGISFTTPSISTTTTYYAAVVNGTCVSASRTAVVATVNSIPTITSVAPSSRCGSGTVVLNATPSIGTVNWYTTPTGGVSIGTGTSFTTPTISNTTTYYAEATNGSCNSATRSAVVATINPAVVISSTTPNTRCGAGTVTLNALASAGTISWFSNSIGGTSIGTGSTFSTPSIAVTTTYYVEASNGICTSTRVPVVATIDLACGLTWTGTINTQWNQAGNWDLGFVPTSLTNVTVPVSVASGNMPIVSATSLAATINNNGSITLTTGSNLNVYGNINNQGSFNVVPGANINVVGSAPQIISGVSQLNNITINNNSGAVISNPLLLKGTLRLVNGALTTNGNVQIDIDNGGNVGYVSGDNGSVSGNITVFRSVSSIKTHYISCPLNNVAITDLTDDAQVINPATNKTRLFNFDVAGQNWVAVNNMSSLFVPSTAYSMFFTAATSVDFTGTYNHSASYTSASTSNAAVNYIFVGNPYPSTLDWDNASGWTKNNIKNAIYYWNPLTNSYASYVSGFGTNGGTQYVPAMNSFFVATSGTGGTSSVGINNNARSTQYASFWRTRVDESIRITLKNSTFSDEAIIRFNDDATDNYDDGLDAYKMLNTGTSPSIYTSILGDKYSINSLSNPFAQSIIPIAVKVAVDGNYVLSINNSDPNINYTLIDKKLGTETIVDGSDYAFNALKTDNPDRFELKLNTSITTSTQQLTNISAMKITSSIGGFNLHSNSLVGTSATIEIIDMSGKSVAMFFDSIIESTTSFKKLDLPDATYIVKVTIGTVNYIDQIVLVK
jgi:hypothetical protein